MNKSRISHQLERIIDGNYQQIYQTINCLIDDEVNRPKILKKLELMLDQQSEIVYNPIPKGMSIVDKNKYHEIIKAHVSEQAIIQTILGIIGPKSLLDSDRLVRLIDKSGMLKRLGFWHHHITTMKERARKVANKFKQEYKDKIINKVKIYGLGGSGAPHDIAVDIINNYRKSSTEIQVIHTDTPNPDYVDENTLVLLCSFSGDTEETINCYYTLKDKTDLFVIIARGGKLLKIAKELGILYVKIPNKKSHPAFVKQPRESVCIQLTATLTLLSKIGLKPGSSGKFEIDDLKFDTEIFPMLKRLRKRFGPEAPFDINPAKQLAFFLLFGVDYFKMQKNHNKFNIWDKKIPYILVDHNNKGIGHEVRTQIHERSKLNAAFYTAPEFLHNFVESMRASIESSIRNLGNDKFVYYFIRSVDEQDRIRHRLNKTIDIVIKGKGNYSILNVEGKNPYERALFSTYFNAHMTTYMGILNGFDPLPVPTMSWLKNIMGHLIRGREEKTETQITNVPILDLYENNYFTF